MTLRTDSLFPIAVLALLAALTFWLDRITRPEQPRTDGRMRHDPDFIVERFDARQFGENGALRYALAAERMVHYPEDGTTIATRPALSYFGDPGAPHLSSDRARISADASVIVLIDNVEARREATGRTPQMLLSTNELTVKPDEGVATTPAPVRIVHGTSVITGKGLELNNRDSTAMLKSNVRATIRRPTK